MLRRIGGEVSITAQVYVFDRASRTSATRTWPTLPEIDTRAVAGPDGRIYVFEPATWARFPTERVDTEKGFVVFNHLGTLPGGVRVTADKLWDDFDLLREVAYLGADGDRIAAQRIDGEGERGKDIPGLPTLDAFPSLHGEFEIMNVRVPTGMELRPHD